MKFATAKEHRDFFQKHGWIEFDGFISDEQLALANQAIDQVLAERLKISSDRLGLLSSEKFFLEGRDLWRSNQTLRKLAVQPRFVEISSDLIEKKPLRLGYDQLLPGYIKSEFLAPAQQVYSHFLEQTANLEDVSCLKGVVCGLILALGGKQERVPEKISSDGINIFPSQPGRVIFFKPNLLVNWNDLYNHAGQRFYMIVYTQAFAYYQLQPKDPHTHSLKRIGYVFNDKLNDKLNPIVYR
jgi:hypothetical protein